MNTLAFERHRMDENSRLDPEIPASMVPRTFFSDISIFPESDPVRAALSQQRKKDEGRGSWACTTAEQALEPYFYGLDLC
jgi:hypothetical protein